MRTSKMHFVTIGSLTLTFIVASCEMASNTDPEPPTGGRKYAMDYNLFAAEIDTILTAHGCDNDYCHGGGIRGTFQLSPTTDKDIHFDFLQVSLQVTPADPAGSPLLVKPLAESSGGIAHTADSSRYGFLSTGDPHYQAILAWIEAGEYR
ncbi:MAG: hypothetical protein KAJ17_04030 [Candidatus Krumholzibacteria bacterium]|nr:hypothetical protein [Candidatus Krumholzibacteria bacterium]